MNKLLFVNSIPYLCLLLLSIDIEIHCIPIYTELLKSWAYIAQLLSSNDFHINIILLSTTSSACFKMLLFFY